MKALARDTLFPVLMIVLNGIVGVTLLIGAHACLTRYVRSTTAGCKQCL